MADPRETAIREAIFYLPTDLGALKKQAYEAVESLMAEAELPRIDGSWLIWGCPVCVYSGHGPQAPERCPNDGVPLIQLPGLVESWLRLAEIKARFRPRILAALRLGKLRLVLERS